MANPATVTYQIDRDEMRRRGRVGAFVLHSKYDPQETTKAARAAFNARFEREVDPDGTLPPEERARRAGYAKKAYYLRLAMKGVAARKAKKQSAA
jgi:hypothetical protein